VRFLQAEAENQGEAATKLLMPEIIIQSNGDLLIPRGTARENQFFKELLTDMVADDTRDSLDKFFAVTDDSEIIFGSSGLCG